MVDVVLNHAGYGTEDYFNSILKDQDGNSISMIRGKDTTIMGDDVRDFLSGLPDFVTEKADVRNQLVEWQTEWMTKYDIDYYRVDTVKHVDAGYANTAGELGTGTMDSLLDFDFNDKAEALKVFKVAAALQLTAKGCYLLWRRNWTTWIKHQRCRSDNFYSSQRSCRKYNDRSVFRKDIHGKH